MTATAGSGSDPVLGQMEALDRGLWEVRYRDATRRVERICVTSGVRLIQLRHPGHKCDAVIAQSSAASVTVQYTCRGQGYGRTALRRESSRLVQVQTQGIADGLPFEDAAEARRVGDCGS